MMRRLSTSCLLVLLSVGIAVPAFPQAGTAELSGTILDQGKAVLPGVTVTAVNEATNRERQTVTGPEGKWVIPTLVPGRYTVRAELAGFETSTRSGLVLQVGQELTLNLTLNLAGVREDVTVTAQAPLVETTTTRIGTNISSTDIDSLPSANRSQFSLMQTIPGLVPTLQVGSFEGGQFSANGQATNNNLFLVDGQYDNDSRRGGSQGTQARVALDAMSEYQVQTHQYGAEYGGSTGVVVNSVTKSGTNVFSGRAFEYFQDNKLQATDYFLKKAGDENPDSGSNVFGGSIGGPIVRNKLFFFFNYEGTVNSQAANLNFPADAAPLAVSYSTTTRFSGPNTFLRVDYSLNGNNQLSFRWNREAILTQRDSIEDDEGILDNARHENDAGDYVYSASWTSILSNRMTNEMKVGHVRESLLQGPSLLFDSDWNFVGFHGIDPFSVGSMNSHADYTAGPRNNYTQDLIRDITFDDTVTWIKSGWGGEHTFKAGVAYGRYAALPQGTASNFTGNFGFLTNKPFNVNDPTTYPRRFQINMGQFEFRQKDYKASGYIQDKWELSSKLTLNLGLRYDWQDLTPKTKDAIGPRVGVAYDLFGDGRTLVRGGAGKVYQYQSLTTLQTLAQRAVIAPTIAYDTTQVTSPSVTGTFPVGPNAEATACLNPVAGPVSGEAVMSPACLAFMVARRNVFDSGGRVVNTTTTGPVIDGDRRMAYTWAFSVGVKRELANNMAVSIDYVGNRGYDNTAVIDINEGPLNAAGKVTRLGVATFNAGNRLNLPAAALTATFAQFNQNQTRELGDALNSDFNSLEVGLEKRFSNRWSGRVSYTYGKCNDVGSIIVDSDPRLDYGRCDRDNRHAFATSANVDIGRGLGAGLVFRAYSGYPINETTGSDSNSDGTTNDRPRQGVDDLAALPSGRPGTIVSPVDSRGVAIRNGIDGEKKVLLDARLQYIRAIQRIQAGLFLEIYNLTNRTNFGNPTGSRNSSNFLKTIVADDPRTAQLGVRITF
jgi:outer membrane receptor protein involved in Fe transport